LIYFSFFFILPFFFSQTHAGIAEIWLQKAASEIEFENRAATDDIDFLCFFIESYLKNELYWRVWARFH
jgi:hypothetical protein